MKNLQQLCIAIPILWVSLFRHWVAHCGRAQVRKAKPNRTSKVSFARFCPLLPAFARLAVGGIFLGEGKVRASRQRLPYRVWSSNRLYSALFGIIRLSVGAGKGKHQASKLSSSKETPSTKLQGFQSPFTGFYRLLPPFIAFLWGLGLRKFKFPGSEFEAGAGYGQAFGTQWYPQCSKAVSRLPRCHRSPRRLYAL